MANRTADGRRVTDGLRRPLPGPAAGVSALRTPQSLRDAVEAFEEIGVHELIFDPTVPDLNEVDRLADALL
jgi:hypothetical protein